MSHSEATARFAEPFDIFAAWMKEYEAKEPHLTTAVALATCSPEGRPSQRMVLLRDVSEEGFTFFTNKESRKGSELAMNPYAAMLFFWKPCERQVRVEGRVQPTSDEVSDSYFALRPYGSNIAARVSQQSRQLLSREAFVDAVAEEEKKWPGKEGKDVPRPQHWGGFTLVPTRFEFWEEGANRMHQRNLYERVGAKGTAEDGWKTGMLYP